MCGHKLKPDLQFRMLVTLQWPWNFAWRQNILLPSWWTISGDGLGIGIHQHSVWHMNGRNLKTPQRLTHLALWRHVCPTEAAHVHHWSSRGNTRWQYVSCAMISLSKNSEELAGFFAPSLSVILVFLPSRLIFSRALWFSWQLVCSGVPPLGSDMPVHLLAPLLASFNLLSQDRI